MHAQHPKTFSKTKALLLSILSIQSQISNATSLHGATNSLKHNAATISSSSSSSSSSSQKVPPPSSSPATSHTFSFVNGLNHTLTDAPVDSSFCDPSSPLSLSGYLQVTGSKFVDEGYEKNLFFWFFEKRRKLVTTFDGNKLATDDASSSPPTNTAIPLVLWLTGGPGCSSTLALLVENGPCSVGPDGSTTVVNPYSWNEVAHVLWLDQPAGVGYSYGEENDGNERMVGEDVYYFLQSFYGAHPEYVDCPLHIVGESYGGHYAPAIAYRVLKGNEKRKRGTVRMNLRGLAVGNGWTDPSVQYQYYAEMAYNNSHHIKTIRRLRYEYMTEAIPNCVRLVKRCTNSHDWVSKDFWCQEALGYCDEFEIQPFLLTGLNPYNIQLPCDRDRNPLCYNFTNVETFLNLNSTRKNLHVSEKKGRWYSCDGFVHWKFTNDWMTDLSWRVARVLEAGVSVLIYAGDLDFLCNYIGNEAWTRELAWESGDEFRNATLREWVGESSDGSGRGLVRSAKGLTFLQVYDAGHMVPMDQPVVALDMIKTFLEGREF